MKETKFVKLITENLGNFQIQQENSNIIIIDYIREHEYPVGTTAGAYKKGKIDLVLLVKVQDEYQDGELAFVILEIKVKYGASEGIGQVMLYDTIFNGKRSYAIEEYYHRSPKNMIIDSLIDRFEDKGIKFNYRPKLLHIGLIDWYPNIWKKLILEKLNHSEYRFQYYRPIISGYDPEFTGITSDLPEEEIPMYDAIFESIKSWGMNQVNASNLTPYNYCCGRKRPYDFKMPKSMFFVNIHGYENMRLEIVIVNNYYNNLQMIINIFYHSHEIDPEPEFRSLIKYLQDKYEIDPDYYYDPSEILKKKSEYSDEKGWKNYYFMNYI